MLPSELIKISGMLRRQINKGKIDVPALVNFLELVENASPATKKVTKKTSYFEGHMARLTRNTKQA